MTAVTPLSKLAVDGIAARWRATPWDAEGLGVAATAELIELDDGSPVQLAAVLAALDAAVGALGCALCTTRVATERTAVVAALAAAGYRAVETSHALTLDLAARDPRAVFGRTVEVEPAVAGDADELAALAAASFDYSRFHEDPRIDGTRARARYRRWIVDSLTNGDQVWIHRRHGVIAAVMSFRRPAPDRVGLLLGGARPDQTLIAPMFWAGVLAALRDDGVATVTTRVSAANHGALRLHDALGFTITQTAIGATKLYAPALLASPLAERTAVRT